MVSFTSASGVETVTEKVTVTESPGARFPVQVMVAAASSKVRVPAVVVASPL
jgi:hypothetical protein